MSVIDDVKVIIGEKEPYQKTKASGAFQKILIVEDDPILSEMYKDKFLKEKFQVDTAENGKIGLEKAQENKPGIILLDLMMPVMDGKTMLRHLREIPGYKKLPVIVLTNAGEVDNIRETQRYDNAVEFLVKSNVTVEEIAQKVKFWLPAIL